jgi:hypothetical protein
MVTREVDMGNNNKNQEYIALQGSISKCEAVKTSATFIV